MLTVADSRWLGPRLSRRNLLHVGALALGGLSLPALLRRQAEGSADRGRGKSVIMIWQRGGPSHIDSFDMKPAAPPEIRGEFHPISTNVPGIEICEHMPKLATMADRLAIIRGIKSTDLGDHTPHFILTGFPDRGRRPTIGAIYSYLNRQRRDIPPYVSTFGYDYGEAHYTGAAHRPFIPDGAGLNNLALRRELTLPRLDDRRELLAQLDALRQHADLGVPAGPDAFTNQAIEIIASPKAREAFDLGREPTASRERYGDYCKQFLLARRLVEAGVSIVTLKVGDWDTHENNFRDMREQLPLLDQGFHALISDLYDRGLENDVAVVLWGEFGRAPRISRIDGRDHWPQAGAAVLAGGAFRVGQVIGATDRHGGQATSQPYTPSNIFANLYRHLGIDPATTIPDFANRPMHVLDDRQLVREL
ncbi:MAG: DUF1501 domain-containing protein [Planctomycetaceae bacterium]|nr:DUF1501 domain-containing protein [Planctomycetaceae bacterium]